MSTEQILELITQGRFDTDPAEDEEAYMVLGEDLVIPLFRVGLGDTAEVLMSCAFEVGGAR